jgi:hypothetical protein
MRAEMSETSQQKGLYVELEAGAYTQGGNFR